MIIFHKSALCVFALGLMFQSCSTVGKDAPFTEFTKEVSVLKAATNAAMDLTKLNFADQIKAETIADVESTAGQNEANDRAVKNIAAVQKKLKLATDALADALEDPKTDELTRKKLAAARKEAEAAVQKAFEEAKRAGQQANVANTRLAKTIDSFEISVSGKDPLTWGNSLDLPSYFELIRMRDKAVRCVDVVEEYSKLLAELASPGLVDAARFQNAADQLNASATSLFPGSGEASALISTAAVYSARVYIQNRQAKDLQKVITANQSNIERFSKLMEDAITSFVENARKYYSRHLKLVKSKVFVPGDDGKAGRVAAVTSLVSTNETYITLLESMKRLRESYRKLPVRHLALAKTVVSPAASLAYIESASSSAASAATQFERSAERNRYQDAMLAAKASDELAVKFERRATAAEAETNLAKSKVDMAQAVAENDPKNAETKAEFLRLKQEYLEFKLKSDDIRAQAVYYRSHANIDKSDADRMKPASESTPKS